MWRRWLVCAALAQGLAPARPPPRRAPARAASAAAAAPTAPLVSVMVVTYNRPRLLERCLAQIAAQDYPALEVLVVDDSDDGPCVERFAAAPARFARGSAALDALGARLRPLGCGRLSIGAKRNLAAAAARGAVVVTWDDDDEYAPDRVSAQVAPILAGEADATVCTPFWRWDAAPAAADADAAPDAREALGGGGGAAARAALALYAALDAECENGLEMVDEAISTLAYRTALWRGADAAGDGSAGDGPAGDGGACYPDSSYDEDRAFVAALKARGARFRRLPPGAPGAVHVKHAASVVRGPMTLAAQALHARGLGALARPAVVAPAALGAALAVGAPASRALRAALHALGLAP